MGTSEQQVNMAHGRGFLRDTQKPRRSSIQVAHGFFGLESPFTRREAWITATFSSEKRDHGCALPVDVEDFSVLRRHLSLHPPELAVQRRLLLPAPSALHRIERSDILNSTPSLRHPKSAVMLWAR